MSFFFLLHIKPHVIEQFFTLKVPSGQGDQSLLQGHDVSARLTLAEVGTVCVSPAFEDLTPWVRQVVNSSSDTRNSGYYLEINGRWAAIRSRSYTNLATMLHAQDFSGSGVGKVTYIWSLNLSFCIISLKLDVSVSWHPLYAPLTVSITSHSGMFNICRAHRYLPAENNIEVP